jgi:hypothetical protein
MCGAPSPCCADPLRVRILDGDRTVIATHARSYDRRQQIECDAHLEALVACTSTRPVRTAPPTA